MSLACGDPIDIREETGQPQVFDRGVITENTYDNPALKFKFSVPEGWLLTMKTKAPKVLVVIVKAVENPNTNDLITVELNNTFKPGTIMEKFDQKLKKLSKFYRRLKVHKKETVDIAGQKGGVLIYQLDPERRDGYTRFILTEHNKNHIEFCFTEPGPDDPELGKLCEHIIGSTVLY